MRVWIFSLLVLLISGCTQSKDPRVLIAILARNKAHTLPKYLECIENLDYDKKSITLYINTNNNTDQTEEILEEWVSKVGVQYRQVILEVHSAKELLEDASNPHAWNSTRFSVIGRIRQQSMEKTLDCGCDYYFVADCDNFVAPQTLKKLVAKKLPVVAPMLETIPGPQAYSNFFCDVDALGYWKEDAFYYEIQKQRIRGTFEVPVVHCTYLIRADQIPKLTYLDDTGHHEFVIFSRSARQGGTAQYICNEEPFGYLFLPTPLPGLGDVDLESEKKIFSKLVLEL